MYQPKFIRNNKTLKLLKNSTSKLGNCTTLNVYESLICEQGFVVSEEGHKHLPWVHSKSIYESV